MICEEQNRNNDSESKKKQILILRAKKKLREKKYCNVPKQARDFPSESEHKFFVSREREHLLLQENQARQRNSADEVIRSATIKIEYYVL